jgi:hypothetical protein
MSMGAQSFDSSRGSPVGGMMNRFASLRVDRENRSSSCGHAVETDNEDKRECFAIYIEESSRSFGSILQTFYFLLEYMNVLDGHILSTSWETKLSNSIDMSSGGSDKASSSSSSSSGTGKPPARARRRSSFAIFNKTFTIPRPTAALKLTQMRNDAAVPLLEKLSKVMSVIIIFALRYLIVLAPNEPQNEVATPTSSVMIDNSTYETAVFHPLKDKNSRSFMLCELLGAILNHKAFLITKDTTDKDFLPAMLYYLIKLLMDDLKALQQEAMKALREILECQESVMRELLTIKKDITLQSAITPSLVQDQSVDCFTGGFDLLLHNDFSMFLLWFSSLEEGRLDRIEARLATKVNYYNGRSGSSVLAQVCKKWGDESVARVKTERSNRLQLYSMRERRTNATHKIVSRTLTIMKLNQQEKYGRDSLAERQWNGIIDTLKSEGLFYKNYYVTHSFSGDRGDLRLDYTEGPSRMRKKLTRTEWKLSFDVNTDGANTPRGAAADRKRIDQSVQNLRQSQLIEPSTQKDLGDTVSDPNLQADGDGAGDGSGDGKRRGSCGFDTFNMLSKVDKLLNPLLEPGDELLKKHNCSRIMGMDSSAGILLFCKDNLYIIDKMTLDEQGNLVEAGRESETPSASNTWNSSKNDAKGIVTTNVSDRERAFDPFESADQRTLTANGVKTWLEEDSNPNILPAHRRRMWPYDDVVDMQKRRYLLRHVAVEIFFNDGSNHLITFEKHKQREKVFDFLKSRCPFIRAASSDIVNESSFIGMNASDGTEGTISSALLRFKSSNKAMQEKWQIGEISNFDYIMHLNMQAGRSFNDLTQYPVFPWILKDYESDVLNLEDPGIYRDLSRPMGALHREEQFRERYSLLDENYKSTKGLTDVPFHYGTHYSSAATTLHYLVRLQPFTNQAIQLQSGRLDKPDRLFTNVGRSWSCSSGNEDAKGGTQDVRELIPEFYYLPDMFENKNQYNLGTKQDGTVVGDVELPPWAHGSAREFVRKHRMALESQHVTDHLHLWIDLIFGYKQRDEAAKQACNVFHHLTYEGSIDLDKIDNDVTREASIAMIHEFGQTPSQLFKRPHPVCTKNEGNGAGSKSFVARGRSRFGSSSNYSQHITQLSIFDAVEKLRAQNERSICEAWTCEKPSLGGGRWFHSQTSNRSRYVGLGSLSLVETSNPGTYRTVSLGSRCVQLHSKSQEYLSWGHGDGTLKHWGMSPHECGTNGQFSGKLLAVHDLNHIMPGLLKVLYSIRHMSHPL